MAAMKVAGAQATVQAMNPAQQFDFQMTQLTQLYNAGVISLELMIAVALPARSSPLPSWLQMSGRLYGLAIVDTGGGPRQRPEERDLSPQRFEVAPHRPILERRRIEAAVPTPLRTKRYVYIQPQKVRIG